jgi:hypothetical protein
MVDTDTSLATLYVMVDEICQSQLPAESHCGPQAILTRSEVVTLGLFGQWACFPSERAFYRYAQHHLRAACPTLPHRTQFNRLLRRHCRAIVGCFWHVVARLMGRQGLYEALHSSAVSTRDAKRRGAGWLPGLADIGWSNRLGWYEGFHLRIAVNPYGGTRTPHVGAWGGRLWGPRSAIKVVRGWPRLRAGGTAMGHRSCARRSGITGSLGPSRRAVGWPECARSSRRSTTRCTTPSASVASVLLPSLACRLAWRPDWRCITSVSGSTSNWTVRLSPLQTLSIGDTAMISHQAFKYHRNCLLCHGASGAQKNTLKP